MQNLILTIHVVLAVSLVGIILLQKTGEGALSGLGGSAGASGLGAIFSRKSAGDFITKLTTGLAIAFMLTSIMLTILVRQQLKAQEAIIDGVAASRVLE
ncbi:MAG: preprotein translocase subunit SecG [Alphaproteobacteria bacterium]|nr:preprotein translocase subunit SecG [Alphaproteobacteria bacterium]